MGLKLVPKLILGSVFIGLIGWGLNIGMDKFSNKTSGGVAKSTSQPAAINDSDFGTKSNPLKVSIVSFHGYAPALVANGNNLDTQPGSIFEKAGVNVKFVINDDVPTLSTLFTAKTAQCAWRTSDFWAQEQPNLRNSNLDAKAVMVVDNTQGGDAIIAKDTNIKSVEDLAGKSVALLQFTPSHGLLIDAINNSSLSAKKKASIKMVFVNADEGTGGVRAVFQSGKVDAAVLWDPDLALAIKSSDAHVVYSTKSATNLIFDVIVCDQRVINNPSGKIAIQKFVNGWMSGVKASRADKDNAVVALTSTEKMFAAIAKQEGNQFVKGLFDNVVWTGAEDNARILGLTSGGTNHYERVYSEFDQIYRSVGALANPQSPVITPQDSFDYSFIKNLLASTSNVEEAVSKMTPKFSEAGLAKTSKLQVTKPVIVKFQSGSSELNQLAKRVIDTEMVPFIENNGAAYIEISGNTDSIGSQSSNKPLSYARAKVVVDYLVKQWDMNSSRFKVVGNGSSNPICDEANLDGVSIEECRSTNRATRVGILH